MVIHCYLTPFFAPSLEVGVTFAKLSFLFSSFLYEVNAARRVYDILHGVVMQKSGFSQFSSGIMQKRGFITGGKNLGTKKAPQVWRGFERGFDYL